MARYRINGYTDRNPDFTFEAEMPGNFNKEQAAQAVAEELHDCNWQREMSEAAQGWLFAEERPDLADDKSPQQRVFIYYGSPQCRDDENCASKCAAHECSCESEDYMLTFDKVAE